MIPNPSEVDFVIYHANCSDGMGAAWAAWKLLGDSAEYYPTEYGRLPPDVEGKNVAILDFSYDLFTLEKMKSLAKGLVVLDHHKTAIDELGDFDCACLDASHSGAILSWNFFHPGEEPPLFLKYIEDRDLWKFSLSQSKEFSTVFYEVPLTFPAYDAFLDESVVNDACLKGSNVIAYVNDYVEKFSEYALRANMHGYSAAVANSSVWISEIGNRLSRDVDFAAVWHYDYKIEKYRVSLRTCKDDVDVSTIAKFWGGGGHKKAAGFTIDKDADIRAFFERMKTILLS